MMLMTGRFHLAIVCLSIFSSIPLAAQPVARRPGLIIKQMAFLTHNTVRIKRDPVSGRLYVLQNNGQVRRVDFIAGGDSATFTTVYTTADHGLNAPLGMTFGSDGTMYLIGNDSTGIIGTATIVRGVPDTPGSEHRTWNVIAHTVPYAYGNIYNHRMSGAIVSPAGDTIFVNSGAATDHGEMHNGTREVGLTSIILKLPTNGQNILLQDDRSWLRANGYLFAEGIRNSFDYAYSGNGDLFDVQNSGDRDDPEEMNWLREGHHYGFPWRIGRDITPQQFTPYNPHQDPLLNPAAWGGGNLYATFSNDPTYPQKPDSLVFTDPVSSYGPDADKFRDTATGAVEDASDLGVTIPTFTGHRSPDGIVFDRDSLLAGDLKGGAFVISYANNNLTNALADTGGDLLLVDLQKDSANYSAQVKRLVSGFNSPLGIELVKDTLYVAETGLEASNPFPKLWRIILPLSPTTGVDPAQGEPIAFELRQNYPNPFNPSTAISYQLSAVSHATLTVYDILGRRIATLVDGVMPAGTHTVTFDASRLASGIYFYRLSAGNFTAVKKMMLVR